MTDQERHDWLEWAAALGLDNFTVTIVPFCSCGH